MSTSSLSAFPLGLSLSGVLSILFYLVLFVALLMTVIFLYHWLRYNLGVFRAIIVIGIYGVGLFFLMTTALGFLLSI